MRGLTRGSSRVHQPPISSHALRIGKWECQAARLMSMPCLKQASSIIFSFSPEGLFFSIVSPCSLKYITPPHPFHFQLELHCLAVPFLLPISPHMTVILASPPLPSPPPLSGCVLLIPFLAESLSQPNADDSS